MSFGASHLRKRLGQLKSVLVQCPDCPQTSFTVKDFRTQHVLKHGIKTHLQCPFCLGNYSWKSRCKQQPENIQHIYNCMLSLIRSTSRYFCKPCKDFDSNNLKHLMDGRNFLNENSKLYESVFEKPEFWSPREKDVTFSQESGLGDDIFTIFRIFTTDENLSWSHVIIRHYAFSKFIEVFTPIQDDFVVLPFWCLCDGARENSILHRHMILAYRKNSTFRKVWKYKFKIPKQQKFLSKTFMEIKNPFHLASAIRYVSQKKASTDNEKYFCDDFSHFYINRPLYPHVLYTLCSLFKGGISKYLKILNGNKNISLWIPHIVQNEANHFVLPIRYLNLDIRKCVIPIAKHLDPKSPSSISFYKKNKFVLNSELLKLTRDEWYVYHAEKNFTFPECIESRNYFLSPLQVRIMRDVLRTTGNYKLEMLELKRENDVLKTKVVELECKNNKLETENEELKRKNNKLVIENEGLK